MMEQCLHSLRFLWWIGGSFMDCSGKGAHAELADSLKVKVRYGE